MRGLLLRTAHLVAALAVPSLLLAAAAARGDGVSAQIEPTFSATSTTSTDATGRKFSEDVTQLTQQYRLSFDRTIYERLRLTAGGNLNWSLGSQNSGGAHTEASARDWLGFGQLTFGDRVLGGTLSYDHHEQSSSFRTGTITANSPILVSETFSGNSVWRPADLPSVNLRLSTSDNHDRQRQITDTTNQEAYLGLTYQELRGFDLRYSAQYTRAEDHLGGAVSTSLANIGQASWSDNFFDGRTSVFLSYLGNARFSETTSGGGTVSTVRSPTGGFSLVETPLVTPTNVKLNLNPALIDGDTASGAGLDIGFAPAESGDLNFRDMGVQLADAVTPVNFLYVWVDRALPVEVVNGFAWSVYRSDDNLNWTPVPIVGSVQFGTFLNRFEIPIQQTSASYLKVVTRPLAPTVTLDRRFADVLVTELQALLVVSAASARGSRSDLSGALNAALRQQLVSKLSYDAALSFRHTNTGPRTYLLSNGLSYADRLRRDLGVVARFGRVDSDDGLGHHGAFTYAASASYDPLPTLGGNASYGGAITEGLAGTTVSNSLSLIGHAELYDGVSLASNAAFGLATTAGRTTQAISSTTSASIRPHPTTSVSGSYGVTRSEITGGTQASQSFETQQINGTLSLEPFPALTGGASITRLIGGLAPPTTLASFNANFSPFAGGALLLRFQYAETLDTTNAQRNRNVASGFRWTIRPGTTLDVNYTWQTARSPTLQTQSQGVFADLLIQL